VANQVIKSNRLGSAASNLTNQINLARVTAVRLNKPVEMRFFSYVDAQQPGSNAQYRASQIWVGDAPYQPLTTFDDGVVIATGTSSGSWSSLLDPAHNGGAGQEPPKEFTLSRAAAGTSLAASTFKFQPDGSTNLGGSGHWSLTLAQEQDLAGDVLPANFITIMVDPVNGSVRTLRPD
ncbi:MAG TPA: Verru_Chthon cassette protein D, partial [Verrucomicrobium sp.]|nr:Verru_Chthon cassette protein D [Verrucomicrobium sp.]